MAKKWKVAEAATRVQEIYFDILEREPDPQGYIIYGAILNRGEASVKEVIRQVILSEEYEERFIHNRTIPKAINIAYRKLLNRDADAEGLEFYKEVAEKKGFDSVLNSIIDSKEYKRLWGDIRVPVPNLADPPGGF